MVAKKLASRLSGRDIDLKCQNVKVKLLVSISWRFSVALIMPKLIALLLKEGTKNVTFD